VKYFSNRDFQLQSLPDELDGLTFTRREGGSPAHLDIVVPADSTVYLLIDSDKSTVPNADVMNDALHEHGWTRLDDAECIIEGKDPYIAIYKESESRGMHFSFDGATWAGVVVAAKNLAMDTGNAAAPSATPAGKNPASQLAGLWFQPASGANTTLNADGTAKSKDDVKGTWTVNADRSLIEIQWADGGASEVYRLSHGKWTRYGYTDGKLQSTEEISPP
jgi:hypothetical protein